MWQQTYTPIGNSLPLSTLFAAIPIFTLLVLLVPAFLAAYGGAGAGLLIRRQIRPR